MTAYPAVELRAVNAGYGRIHVLHDVDIVVPKGSVFALLGPNGAGKSTTLEVMAGTVAAWSGCVHVDGQHVNGTSPERLVSMGVCRIPEGRGIFPNLTVRENLRIWSYGTKQARGEVEEVAFSRFPRLAERRDQLAGSMSGGEQQMLAMARALIGTPHLLLLDEISMGLAPRVVDELFTLVAGLAATGISVVVVEQFAATALAIAHYAAVMTSGTIVAVGQPADVEDLVHEAYLGGAA